MNRRRRQFELRTPARRGLVYFSPRRCPAIALSSSRIDQFTKNGPVPFGSAGLPREGVRSIFRQRSHLRSATLTRRKIDQTPTGYPDWQRHARHSGITLIELVISTAIMSMLFVGMASAISLATKSVPDSKSLSTVNVSTQKVLEQLAGEAAYATTVTSLTSTQFEFTVADRDGSLPSPEKIKYSWSGAGNALKRTYNLGTATNVIDSVQSLTFTTETMTDSGSTVVVAVRCDIQTTSDTRTKLATSFRLLNRPAPPP